MAAITAAASGNWNVGATWTGGVAPGTGDTCTIGAFTVTIPSGVTITIGDGTTADACLLSTATSRLTVNGTLIVVGNLKQSGAGSIVEFVSTGATQAALTLKNSATLISAWLPTASLTAQMVITGTVGHPVIVTTDITAGGTAGRINMSGFNPIVNWSRFEFRDVGSAGAECVTATLASQVTLSDGLFLRCGAVRFTGGTATAIQSFTRIAFVDTVATAHYCLNLSNITTKTGGTRLVDSCTFYHSGDAAIGGGTKHWLADCANLTVNDCVFANCFPKTSVATSIGIAFTRCWVTSQISGSGSRLSLMVANTNVSYTDCGIVAFGSDASGGAGDGDANAHYLLEGAATYTLSDRPLVVDSCVVDGFGSCGAGDVVLPQGFYRIDNSIFINRCGNLTDNIGDATHNPCGLSITRNTAYKTNHTTSTNGGSVVMIENASLSNADMVRDLKNNLFSDSPHGVCQGTGVFTSQGASFVMDYNAYFNMAQIYNYPDAGGHRTYLAKPWSIVRVSGGAGTATYSDATHVTVTDASGVIVGDLFIRNTVPIEYCAVTAVAGNILTLGQRMGASFGTLGVTTTTASAYIVNKAYKAGVNYGAANFGQHDTYGNPAFVDATRTASTWDTGNGGAGTFASLQTAILKRAGFAASGAPASYNTAYDVQNYLDYIRAGFTPTNSLLSTAASDGSYVGAVNFTGAPITPTLSSVTPTNGQQGAAVPVTLTGADTTWGGTTTVSVSGTGVTVSAVSAGSATSLTATFTITGAATIGARTITVTTGSEVVTGTFTVTGSTTGITSITPLSGTQGTVVPVSLVGNATTWGGTTTVSVSGTGVTVSAVSAGSATSLTATFTITGGATAGPRVVTVTTGAQVVLTTFTVTEPVVVVPSLVSVSPASGRPGEVLSITILGDGTNFSGSSVVTLSGSGVIITGTSAVSATTITCMLTIDAGATLGVRILTVTTGSELVTTPFTITTGNTLINPGWVAGDKHGRRRK